MKQFNIDEVYTKYSELKGRPFLCKSECINAGYSLFAMNETGDKIKDLLNNKIINVEDKKGFKKYLNMHSLRLCDFVSAQILTSTRTNNGVVLYSGYKTIPELITITNEIDRNFEAKYKDDIEYNAQFE